MTWAMRNLLHSLTLVNFFLFPPLFCRLLFCDAFAAAISCFLSISAWNSLDVITWALQSTFWRFRTGALDLPIFDNKASSKEKEVLAEARLKELFGESDNGPSCTCDEGLTCELDEVVISKGDKLVQAGGVTWRGITFVISVRVRMGLSSVASCNSFAFHS